MDTSTIEATETTAMLPEGRALATNEPARAPALRAPKELSDGNRWHDVPNDDPLLEYLERYAEWVPRAVTSFSEPRWQFTRLLGAAYVYRSVRKRARLVAKFYSTKTSVTPELFAARELAAIERARLTVGRAVLAPVTHWRGVLFMPFVSGLTLENLISVRRSRADELGARLGEIAELLAALHTGTADPDPSPDFAPALEAGQRFVNHLVNHGPLAADPLLRRAIDRLLSRWGRAKVMHEFVPVFVHGDTTTGNFIFGASGKAVALDWERARLADPAHDLGRLSAEVTHSIAHNGGTVAEALPIVDQLTEHYCALLPGSFGRDALRARAAYYHAISCLRIARNAWSEPRRVDLIAQAIALLSEL